MTFSRLTVLLCMLFALGASPAPATSPEAATVGPKVEIVTSQGTIVVQLDAVRTPKTTANFMHYVDTKFYNGGSFFRAVPGFVIQGGNKPKESDSDTKLELETPAKTGVLNTDGAISMARTRDPNSATSEFFICDGQQPFLNGTAIAPGYAAFGHVISGMDVVRKIARLPVDGQMLLEPVTIEKITRLK